MAPPAHLLRRSARALAPLALAFSTGACTSEGSTAEGVTHPTMIEVVPQEFLGDLGCSAQSAAVQRYVATLFDVTDEEESGGGKRDPSTNEPLPCGGFQLPSSAPTACLASVGFGYVVAGRRYCVEVDAYDTDQIEPRGAGIRQMLVGDPNDGELSQQAPAAVAKWTTSCAGATAATETIVQARGCLPLDPQPQATDPAAVLVPTETLLGELGCGDEPGQVDYLDVELTYEGLADDIHRTPSCGEAALFEDLPGDTEASLFVRAFSGSDYIAAASCRAVTAPGTTVTAECTPLSRQGSLRVDFEAALAIAWDEGRLTCDVDSIQDVRVAVEVDGETVERSFPPPDCQQPFDFAFTPGPEEESVTVTIVVHPGAESDPVVCHGNVELGRVVVAQCEKAEDIP